MSQIAIYRQLIQYLHKALLLLVVSLSLSPVIGKTLSTIHIPESSRFNWKVSAATAPNKQSFSEAVALQFFVDKDYGMTVQGVIELKNKSGKDISLTKYDMDLPYLTLKETKIGSISPNAFLVDMYSERNSILFSFRSLYTKPVVIGKNGRITFNFSAKIDKPYNDYGGLRTLNFPFSLASDNRTLSITIHLSENNKVLYAPMSPPTLKAKNIYALTPTSGKTFIFQISEFPITFALSSGTEIPLPLYIPEKCETVQPQSCSGCHRISWYKESGEAIATKVVGSNAIATTFTKSITKACFPISTTFVAGLLIIPEKKALVPASWKVSLDGGHSDFYLDGVPFAYSEPNGYLSIPMFTCKDDSDCNQAVQKLKTYNLSLTNDQTTNLGNFIKPATNETISLRNFRQGKDFFLEFSNTTNNFLLLKDLSIDPTTQYELLEKPNLILPPKETYRIQLVSKKSIQTSNQPVNLVLKMNDTVSFPFTINPVTVTVLVFIEFLAYVFVISLSVALVTSVGIFLYNKKYEKSTL